MDSLGCKFTLTFFFFLFLYSLTKQGICFLLVCWSNRLCLLAPLDLFSANDRLSTSLQWVCWAQSFGINDRSVGTWLCCEIKITACCDLFWHLEMMIMEQIDREKKYSTVAAMLKCSHQLMSSWQHRHHQKHPALLNKMKKKKKDARFLQSTLLRYC